LQSLHVPPPFLAVAGVAVSGEVESPVSGMMVLLELHVHLQNDVASVVGDGESYCVMVMMMVRGEGLLTCGEDCRGQDEEEEEH